MIILITSLKYSEQKGNITIDLRDEDTLNIFGEVIESDE
jgi:hypothetical protein